MGKSGSSPQNTPKGNFERNASASLSNRASASWSLSEVEAFSNR